MLYQECHCVSIMVEIRYDLTDVVTSGLYDIFFLNS